MTVRIICENPWHDGYTRLARDEAEAEEVIAHVEADASDESKPGAGCIGPHVIEVCRGTHQ